MALERLSEAKILERVKRIVARIESPFLCRFPLRIPSKRLFIDTLFRLRHRPYRVKDEPPPIRFLDGRFDATVSEASVDLVQPLLDKARGEPNYQKRLTILWFAIRTLMGVPYTTSKFRGFVPLWEDALGAWNSTGAWYGLHGHAAMAGLAGLCPGMAVCPKARSARKVRRTSYVPRSSKPTLNGTASRHLLDYG